MRRFAFLALAVLIAVGCSSEAPLEATEGAAKTALWDGLLRRYGIDGGLDYEGLAGERPVLDEYLDSVAATDLAALGEKQRLAFWLNAYNAGVARFVLERYPGLESVETVDGFFDELRFPVAGRSMTLDEVEGEARAGGDARVHFAVVCASTSCPDLLAEAYVGDRLEQQLESQTRRFLADRSKGLRFDRAEGRLELSSIFKWYAGDFTGGSTVVAFFARSKVVAWISPHLAGELAAELEESEPSVRYLDYDWSLNDR